jgi:hypothetical protein
MLVIVARVEAAVQALVDQMMEYRLSRSACDAVDGSSTGT